MLAEDRFQTDSPRPLKGFFEWLADLLPSFDWLDDLIPGPPGVVWLGLAALIGGIAWVLGRRVLTRRIDTSEAAQAAVAARDDPRTLERLAAEAEAAGEFEKALRLRFRAGLLRLDAARRDRVPPVDLHPRGEPEAALGGLRRAGVDVRRRRLRRTRRRGRGRRGSAFALAVRS